MSSPSCAICHDIYIGSDDIVITPCGHIYHRSCLLQWFNQSQYGSPCPKCRKICYRSQLQPVHLDFADSQDESDTVNIRKRKQKNKTGANSENVNTTNSSPRRAPNREPNSNQTIPIPLRFYNMLQSIYGINLWVWLAILVCLSLIVWTILIYRHEIIIFLVYLLIALVTGTVGCLLRIFFVQK